MEEWMADFIAQTGAVEVEANAETGEVAVGEYVLELEEARSLALGILEAVEYLDNQAGFGHLLRMIDKGLT